MEFFRLAFAAQLLLLAWASAGWQSSHNNFCCDKHHVSIHMPSAYTGCRNARYMQDFTEDELAQITEILRQAPEVGFQGETSEETLANLQ